MAKTLQSSALILVLTISAFAAGPREVKPGWNLFSKQQDVQLGREAAAQVERQMPVIHDGQLQDQIERIGKRLVSSGMADQYPYTFKVVNEQSINAFALPGGPTYVHTGLIRAADNEAQLAGVMAHEIAHVALRHGTNQASKANLIQLPAMLAGAVIGNGSMIGQLAQLGIGLGANSVLLKYSRDAETQADVLGARMMAKAGYNPIEMARFFEKLEAQGGRGGPQFMASHPNPGNRMRTIQEEIQYMPRGNYNDGDNAAFQQLKQRVGSLPAAPQGQRARAGAVADGDPRPSGRMREYRNNAFAVAHPDNWEAFGDNQSAMVTIAPRSGLVQDNQGNVAVGYGVMISFASPHSGGRNLRQDTQDLIAQLAQSNPGMQTGGRQQYVRIGRDQGLVTTLYNQSPMGGREINMLVTVERPEGLFYMVFIGPESDFRQLQPIYEQMLRSVRFNS
ncbi:MAG TPA: M48 family metallopeptidase [Bryobacteraceae bacterium]|nr:M48 family metallopeptidase [Bryobacteraceae bacterium]